MKKTTCRFHGEQQQTLVCQHIVEGLRNQTRVGFFWTIGNPDNPRPDAYCSECEIRVRETAGEWVGEALDKLKPQVLCGVCYDAAKQLHMGGDPWT